ncbi:MAG: hypothetical protein MUF23_07690, partial [Pirellula sp.]|nr:hypothetical protein [Pirellula sp.]
MHEDYSSRWLGDLLDRTAAERVRSRMNTRPSLLRTLKSRRSEVLESSRQSHRRALRRRLGMELLEL